MLTRRMQVKAVAERAIGIRSEFKLDDFAEPWRTIYAIVDNAPPGSEKEALMAAVHGHPDEQEISRSIVELALDDGSDALGSKSLADLSPDLKPVEWLWPGWIPLGMLSLLGARPGAGKSYLALDLARRIIQGLDWPDGAPATRPGSNVVYVEAENVARLLNTRADAWEMDTTRLYPMLPKPGGMIDFTELECQDELIELCHAAKPALVVVDSLSCVTSKGENAVAAVRRVLGFLSAIAGDFNTAVLPIHHLRKRGPLAMFDRVTSEDIRGSGHITAIARSVLALSVVRTGEEYDPNGPRCLEVVKSNLASCPQPLGVTLEERFPGGVALRYGELPAQYQPPSETDRCQAWLVATLREEGPMRPYAVIRLARLEGYSERTVYRARSGLKDEIQNTDGAKSRHNKWELREAG